MGRLGPISRLGEPHFGAVCEDARARFYPVGRAEDELAMPFADPDAPENMIAAPYR